MRRRLKMKVLLWVVLGIVLMVSQANAGEKKELQGTKEKQSYSLGADIGNNLKASGLEVDVDSLLTAVFSSCPTLHAAWLQVYKESKAFV